MSAIQESCLAMLEALRDQINMAHDLMKDRDWLIEDKMINPSAQLGDFRIGDFEIKCLYPEKYGLPSRCEKGL